MSQSLNSISLSAPAKINLTLAVLGRRPDGYHDIESWVVKIGCYDHLTLTPASTMILTLQGDVADVAAGESNLVLRAARALAASSGHEPLAAITLEKRIPVGAGLGGGSSDAAATLVGLNKLWGLRWPTERLQSVAAQIGSDVPLFLDEATTMVIRGRGEKIELLSTAWKGWLAIIAPSFSISTAAVYGALGASHVGRRNPDRPWTRPTRSGAQCQQDLFNDLLPAARAVEPRLAALHSALDGIDGHRVHLTGSGSCLFAMFDGRDEAEAWKNSAMPQAKQPVRMDVVPTL